MEKDAYKLKRYAEFKDLFMTGSSNAVSPHWIREILM